MPSPDDFHMEDAEMENTLPDQKSAAPPIPNKQELTTLIDTVGNAPLVENTTWYIVSSKWWDAFIQAVHNGFIDDIGPINNETISQSTQKGQYYLKPRLSEAVDYQTIPEDVFKRLRDIFGLDNDARDYIARDVVQKDNQNVVEVYPRVVHVISARNKKLQVDITLKPNDTMISLRQRVLEELALPADVNIKIYVVNGENWELVDTSQTLDSYFDTAQKIYIDSEVDGEFFYKKTPSQSKAVFGATSSNSSTDSSLPSTSELESSPETSNNSASRPRRKRRYTISSQSATNGGKTSQRRNRRFSASTSSSSLGAKIIWPFLAVWWHFREGWWRFSLIWPDEIRSVVAFFFGWWILRPPARIGNGSYGYSGSSSMSGGSVPAGQCGLQNLGNTCFMASALQCLSNMPQLREYFLSDEYLNDLNEDNPLGTHGNLAQAVGELFKSMWNGQYASVSPRRFKAIIGQFAPRFNGYSQQDSHELMAYVLDGLHEDLNRIKKKPYFEDNDELAKLPLHEYAEKSWEVYKMRNDSIIVDTLHGQLKSTLICPVCAKISIKFDPFGYISLPLPPKEQISRQTVIIMFRERKWAKFSVSLTDQTTVADTDELMRAKIQSEDQKHFVFFTCAPITDEVVLLRRTDTIRQGVNREVYAAEVMHDPYAPGARIVVGYNRFKINRQCSLPMVYTLKSESDFNRKFVIENVLETTKNFFFTKKDVLDDNMGEDENDEISSQNGNGVIDKSSSPYRIMIAPAGSSSPVVLPDNDEAIAFPTGKDTYMGYYQVIFFWKDGKSKFFNQYKGSDLVEREIYVQTRRKVHLDETLDWFTMKEQLGEQDLWYCPECKKHERATKQLDLWKLPEILVLHLKRFQYTRWSREKLTWEVEIPVKGLDLTKKVANEKHGNAVYDLIAVSRHYGSLSGGHYTASGFNDKIKKWIDFNDASATITVGPSDPYESADPYMLVYRRRRLDAQGQPIADAYSDDIYKCRASKRVHQPHPVDENMEMEED